MSTKGFWVSWAPRVRLKSWREVGTKLSFVNIEASKGAGVVGRLSALMIKNVAETTRRTIFQAALWSVLKLEEEKRIKEIGEKWNKME